MKKGEALKATKNGVGAAKLIAALVIVFGVLLAYYYLAGSGSPANAPLPGFAKTNAAMPAQFTSALQQSASLLPNLALLARAHMANSTQFHVSYYGQVAGRPSGSESFLPSFSTPILVRMDKYANSSKLDINVTSAPLIGAVDVEYVRTNNSYLCTNFNSTAISEGKPQALITNKGSEMCKTGTSQLGGIDFAQLAAFNFSQLHNFGIMEHYLKSYQSTFKGAPCTFIEFNLTQLAYNGSVLGTGNLQFCTSDSYYVPLGIGLNMTMNSGGSYYVFLNETEISNSSSYAYVSSLPAAPSS